MDANTAMILIVGAPVLFGSALGLGFALSHMGMNRRIVDLEGRLESACDVGGQRYANNCNRLDALETVAHDARRIARQCDERAKGRDLQIAGLEVGNTARFDEHKSLKNTVETLEWSHRRALKSIDALESLVAGMQIAREVLTPVRERHDTPEMEQRWRERMNRKSLPEPMFHATAYVDGGHAATDVDDPLVGAMRTFIDGRPLTESQRADLMRETEQARDTVRWRTESASDPAGFEADPETVEAQPQPDDDQATEVNDVQAVIDWAEAKRGEVA